MTAPVRGRSGRRTRLLLRVFAGIAVAWALLVSPAFAADTTITPVQELQQGPLIAITCTDCHASISDTRTPGINFSHGAHMTYACTSCHPRFPHFAGVTERPTMAVCFDCHGLRHGPQGTVAAAACGTCHVKPRSALRPASHVGNWRGAGHVAAGATQLSTLCLRCHTKAQCDACHLRTKVSWETTQALIYNPGDGCLACHGSDLPRLARPVTASMLDSSAHRGIACTSCHPDFRYDDRKGVTSLWKVNAGLACTACHEDETKAWKASVHAAKLLSGGDPNGGATCAGCHGGHDIERVKTQAAQARLHAAGQQMCVGSCHAHDSAWASYGDWWHGAAYKRGALDAPACWDCHGFHDVLALKDPQSPTSAELLPKTCGTCHAGSDESFAETGRAMIHGRPQAVSSNPLFVWRANLIPAGK
jgi:hypothetical protein